MSPPAPDPHERRAALALSLADGIGSATFRELVATFGYASRALQARSDAGELLARAEALEQSAARASAALWVIGEAQFPAAFTALDRPPLWVTALGDPALLGPVGVAIVGTRQATPYGVRIARDLATAVVRAGGVVVSGLARGIDGAAHQAALEAGGGTIAVLGTGVDVPYPSSHRALHAEVVRRGLVLSEIAPGDRAGHASFPLRNRLIAALGRVTVVVEAGRRSGASITADHATDLSRDVFAVPGPVDAPHSAGCNALIRDGAHIVTEVADVLLAAGLTVPLASSRAIALAGDAQTVWEALARGAIDADSLTARTRLPARACLAAVTELELAGLVEVAFTGEIRRRGGG